MALLSAVRWLRTTERLQLNTDMVTSPLTIMLHVANAIADAKDPWVFAFHEIGGDQWTFPLWQRKNELVHADRSLFARLLHALERAYLRHRLPGDQIRIRKNLHGCLRKVHDRGGKLVGCTDQCPWISHNCDMGRWPHYHDCPLLGWTAGPHTGPGLIGAV